MRFVNSTYDGLQDATTSKGAVTDGRYLGDSIHAYMRNVDGSVRMELCGSVTGEGMGVHSQPE